jgi:prepilin-type N-terminal cleavage/methylation domain-containing protein
MNKKTLGFTLIEIIVVFVIISVLAMISVSLYMGYQNEYKGEISSINYHYVDSLKKEYNLDVSKFMADNKITLEEYNQIIKEVDAIETQKIKENLNKNRHY